MGRLESTKPLLTGDGRGRVRRDASSRPAMANALISDSELFLSGGAGRPPSCMPPTLHKLRSLEEAPMASNMRGP